MTDDIYAWTIDFTRVQPGDNFKVIYKERIIVEDSTHAGIHSIDAAYFQHRGKDIYAFNYLLPNSGFKIASMENGTFRRNNGGIGKNGWKTGNIGDVGKSGGRWCCAENRERKKYLSIIRNNILNKNPCKDF